MGCASLPGGPGEAYAAPGVRHPCNHAPWNQKTKRPQGPAHAPSWAGGEGGGQAGPESRDRGQLPSHQFPGASAPPASGPAKGSSTPPPRPGKERRAEAAGSPFRGSLWGPPPAPRVPPSGPQAPTPPGSAAHRGKQQASWDVSFWRNHYGGRVRLERSPAGPRGSGPSSADPREAGQGLARRSEARLPSRIPGCPGPRRWPGGEANALRLPPRRR